MIDMTKAEVLAIWKGFVRNMSDQGAVFPFTNEIASRARNSLLAQVEAAEKKSDDVAQQLVQSEQGKRKISEECDELLNALETLSKMAEAFPSELHAKHPDVVAARAAIAKATEAKP